MSPPLHERVSHVLVVVPARDEALRLPACLAALAAASAALRAEVPGGPDAPEGGGGAAPEVRVVVVLDRCRDASAAVVARWPRVLAVTSLAGTAGGARAVGVRAGLAELAAAGTAPHRVWVASTDADSEVPPAWLRHHVRTADAGAALLLGTVVPRADDVPEQRREALLRAWAGGYTEADGHPHVHGANLGVRADHYLAAGGFPALAAHEDVALARAVAAGGGPVVRSAEAPVTTSARLLGRAPEGFAQHLAALQAVLPEQGRLVRAGRRPAAPQPSTP